MTTTIRDKRNYIAENGSFKDGRILFSKKLTTTDATATAIYAIPVPLSTAIAGRCTVVGKKDDSTASIGANVTNFSGRRGSSGNVSEPAAETVVAAEDSAGTPAVTVTANTTDQTIEIKVAGISSENWYWEVHGEYIAI